MGKIEKIQVKVGPRPAEHATTPKGKKIALVHWKCGRAGRDVPAMRRKIEA